MSLSYLTEKINPIVYLTLLTVIVGLLGFGLGRLSKLEDRKVPIVIKNEGAITAGASKYIASYVASKTGSSYYFPWCIGVKKIKEANKIWFDTEEEALSAGYNKAANCRGL